MESPQQLDLSFWHTLYGSDLEEERLMANITHSSLLSPFANLLSSAGDFWKINFWHKEGGSKRIAGKRWEKGGPRDFFQLSFECSRVLPPCSDHFSVPNTSCRYEKGLRVPAPDNCTVLVLRGYGDIPAHPLTWPSSGKHHCTRRASLAAVPQDSLGIYKEQVPQVVLLHVSR